MYNSLCNHSLKCIMSYWLPNSFGLGWNCLQPLTSPESSLLLTVCCPHLAPQKHLSHCTWIVAMRCNGYTGELKPHRFCSVSSLTLCVTVGKVVDLCALFHHLVSGDSVHTLCQALWRALDVESTVSWSAKPFSWQDSVLSLGATVYLKCYFLYFWEEHNLTLIYVKTGNCLCEDSNNEEHHFRA